jgi:hypothetical protein
VALSALTIKLPVLAVAASVIAASLTNLYFWASGADVLDLANSLERKLAQPDANYLARFVGARDLGRSSTNCSDAFTRAGLTVALATLDAAVEQNDRALVTSALEKALDSASHRLSCNPLDGNAWLRYAIVNARREGPDAAVVNQLRLSYRLAPSEAWVIEPRLAFVTNLDLAGGVGSQTGYLADLQRFTSFESPRQIAAAYVGAPQRVRARLHALIALEPVARSKAIVEEIKGLGVDFTQK